MTPAQEEALGRIKQLLMEHFDAHVLSVLMVDDNDKTERNRNFWGGGYFIARGLVAALQEELSTHVSKPPESDE